MASIESRKAKNGAMTYWVRFRIEGQRNPVRERFTDAREAAKFKTLVEKVGGNAAVEIRNVSDGVVGSVPTLAEWFEEYLQDLESHASKGTPYGYRVTAGRTWLPRLGDYPITAITRQAVTAWVAAARKQETVRSSQARKKAIETQRTDKSVKVPEPKYLSTKTIKNAHGVLSGCLNAAVLAGIIPANPAKGVRMPKDEQDAQRERDIFTVDEWTRFLEHLPEHYKPLMIFLLGTGVRIGEATAIQVRDLDLDLSTVHIRRAWKQGPGNQVYLGSPKTRRSNRSILIGPSVVDTLRPLTKDKGAEDLLFTTVRGFRIDSDELLKAVWRPTLKAAGITKHLTTHSLRHTSASWQLMAGTPPQVVQHRLGHESLGTTSRVYAHLLIEEQTSAANFLDVAAAPKLPSD